VVGCGGITQIDNIENYTINKRAFSEGDYKLFKIG